MEEPAKRRCLADCEFEKLARAEVVALADELESGNGAAVDRAVRFVRAETEGLWHGRGRALMCRRMKHVELSRTHREQLLDVILARLTFGHFSEQFRDQLRLALPLDAKETFAAADKALSSDKDYVRRYARWVLRHKQQRSAGGSKSNGRSRGGATR